jgi:hypothetical protein
MGRKTLRVFLGRLGILDDLSNMAHPALIRGDVALRA